jgi:hypothetical protein
MHCGVCRVLWPVRTEWATGPTIIQTAPRPDYFFLWLYAVLSLLPPSMETPALLIGPVIALGVLLALPFFSGEGEKSWRRRPIAVLTILLVAVALGTFTHLAGKTVNRQAEAADVDGASGTLQSADHHQFSPCVASRALRFHQHLDFGFGAIEPPLHREARIVGGPLPIVAQDGLPVRIAK